MFFRKTSTEKSPLDKAIEALLEEMPTHEADDDKYGQLMNRLERLYVLKAQEAPKHVTPDTMAIVAGNIAAVILIVGHERAHLVTSKALNFIKKT